MPLFGFDVCMSIGDLMCTSFLYATNTAVNALHTPHVFTINMHFPLICDKLYCLFVCVCNKPGIKGVLFKLWMFVSLHDTFGYNVCSHPPQRQKHISMTELLVGVQAVDLQIYRTRVHTLGQNRTHNRVETD